MALGARQLHVLPPPLSRARRGATGHSGDPSREGRGTSVDHESEVKRSKVRAREGSEAKD